MNKTKDHSKPKILPTLLKVNIICLFTVFLACILVFLYMGLQMKRYESVSNYFHDYADLYQYGVSLALRMRVEKDKRPVILSESDELVLDVKNRMEDRRSDFLSVYDEKFLIGFDKTLKPLLLLNESLRTKSLPILSDELEESYYHILVYSKKHMHKRDNDFVMLMTIAVTFILLFICSVLFYLRSTIIKILYPLKELTRASEKLSITDEKLDINLNHDFLEYQILAISFRDMYQRISYENRIMSNQSANSSVSYFVENIAHSINNPLATIATSLALIKKKCNNTGDEFLINEVEVCSDQIQRVTDITHKMKCLISTSDKTEPSEFPLSNLTTFINLLFFNRILDKKIKFIIPKEERVIFGLEEVIINVLVTLVENAITYNDNKEPVIEFLVDEDDDCLKLIICDNGTPKSSVEIYQYLLGEGNTSSLSLFTARKLSEDNGYNLYYNESPKKEFVLELAKFKTSPK